jgi:hypothetical protein
MPWASSRPLIPVEAFGIAAMPSTNLQTAIGYVATSFSNSTISSVRIWRACAYDSTWLCVKRYASRRDVIYTRAWRVRTPSCSRRPEGVACEPMVGLRS